MWSGVLLASVRGLRKASPPTYEAPIKWETHYHLINSSSWAPARESDRSLSCVFWDKTGTKRGQWERVGGPLCPRGAGRNQPVPCRHGAGPRVWGGLRPGALRSRRGLGGMAWGATEHRGRPVALPGRDTQLRALPPALPPGPTHAPCGPGVRGHPARPAHPGRPTLSWRSAGMEPGKIRPREERGHATQRGG